MDETEVRPGKISVHPRDSVIKILITTILYLEVMMYSMSNKNTTFDEL